MCINNNNISSNINEVIRAILNFFIQKFHEHQKHKTLTKSVFCDFSAFSAFSAFSV